MTSVKRVERKIQKIEGFLVKILHKDGRDVREDFANQPPNEPELLRRFVPSDHREMRTGAPRCRGENPRRT